MIVNCVGYIHDMELCIKDLLDANKSFKMILGAYGKGSLFAILWRTRGMFCEDQREVKRSPKEFQSKSLSCMGEDPPKKVCSCDFYHRFTCDGHLFDHQS